MPVEYKQTPTPDEARFLRESQWIVGLHSSTHAAIRQWFNELIDSCRELSENCESSNKDVIAGYHIRLKLAKSIAKDFLGWLDEIKQDRKQIFDDLDKEPTIPIQRTSDEFRGIDEESIYHEE